MATKSTDKTIWTLALILIAGFLTWKLWPALKNKLNGGGGSGGGGAIGGTSAEGDENPYGQGGAQQGAGISFGSGNGAGSSQQGGSSSAFGNWLNSVLNQGYQNAYQLGDASTLESSDASGLYSLDEQGLPLETAPGYGDQDQFLITQDVPGSDYTDYGPQTISDDTGDYIDPANDPQQATNDTEFDDGSGLD